MSTPRVSVIIPARNRLPLLREALDSVRAQTIDDVEVLVVDDASDPPLAPLLADHPCRPKVLCQPCRSGPAVARNRGIREARADLIAFLDSDDLWLPGKLEAYLDVWKARSDPCVLFGPMLPIDEAGAPLAGRTKTRREGWITDALFRSCFVDTPTVLCARRDLLAVGGFNETLMVCEDYELWLRLSLSHRFVLLQPALAKRRIHDHRLSKSNMVRNLAVKAAMLSRFFNEHRSTARIDLRAGAARVARVHFLAARAAFQAGLYPQAAESAHASRSCRRAPLRALPLYLLASALARFNRAPVASRVS